MWAVADRLHIRCTACGTPRRLQAFGLEPDGEFEGPPAYQTGLRIQRLSGPRQITWWDEDLPLPLARALRACLAGALERLDAEIEAATEG